MSHKKKRKWKSTIVIFVMNYWWKRGLSHHLYSHLTRGEFALKENGQVIPDTNTDDEMDNEIVRVVMIAKVV